MQTAMKYSVRFLFLLIIQLFSIAGISTFAQRNKTVGTGNAYVSEVQTLVKNKLVLEAFKVIDELEPFTLQELIELTEIPAPPFKENTRAQKVKQLFESAGADKVWMDSVGNVLALRLGKNAAQTVVLDAHLDTVFPEGTDVTVKHRGDTLYAPGI